MKVLVIHNRHRKGSASGDDQVFKNETELLCKHGDKVLKLSVSNDEFDNSNLIKKIGFAFGMIWSSKYYRVVKRIIKDENPDVIHVHTFSPLLSPSILYAAKRSGKPVVATLHDTRFVCPCATSLRNNKICNKCMDGQYFRMCSYKCYKNSFVQSLIMAIVQKYHRLRKTYFRQIDRYICLNDTQIKLLRKAGYDSKKIVKKYNFMDDIKSNFQLENDIKLPERYVVFYGRIGEEKGIRTLMSMWDKICDIPLVVMGTGPMDDEFKEWANGKSNVCFLGYTLHQNCLSIVKNSEFVLFPSIWYEGCSMVMIETQCLGKSIIASDIGFSSEAIQNGFDGYKVPLNNIDAFISRIYALWHNHDLCESMGKNARIKYLENYTPEKNYKELKKIYLDVLSK